MCRYKEGSTVAQVEDNPFRLPNTVRPKSYKLTLAPDLKAATFSGEVEIEVSVSEPVDEIILNAADLQIQNALISRSNGTSLNANVVADEEKQRAHLKVAGTIGKGDWRIFLRFTGILNDKLRGFYRSTYKDAAGSEQVIATTQFESTDARRAFPCFDEPDMKATFKITLVVDKDLVAVSNARAVKVSENAAGKKVVEFAPTMRMSTYIVAFVVGKLASTKAVQVDGTDVRVWCVPGKERMAGFALESAQFALRYYRKYFGVPYPSDKLDLLAIPDFAAGAMENFGCITFRETVLVDVATASQGALDWVAKVVNHEIAHMWFGDLVTMTWWEGIWLNESFATFMETKCTDAFRRQWGVWDKFGLSRGAAFRVDALKSTRPIEFTVVSPDDAQAMFDVLTYEKGCSVMRMLEQYLGEETFQKGIALYISQHLHGNTVTADLWAALESASGQPVTEIMRGWIYASGFPVVTAKLSERAGCVTLSQQAFKYLPDAVDHSQRWMVPIMLRAKTADGVVEMKHLLKEKEETIYVGENLEWVVLNAGGHGFYRTLYSTQLQKRLTSKLYDTLSVIERVNLLSDAWASVQAGLTNSLEFLDLVVLFSEEKDPNVWSMITGPLAALKSILPAANRPQFAELARKLIGPAFQSLGWEAKSGEASQRKELRGALIAAMGFIGADDAVFTRARELFTAWKADRSKVDGDVLGSVVALVADRGDSATYEEFYALSKAATNPEDEGRFLDALAGFDDNSELVQRTLKLCIDPREIRTQDAPDVFSALIRSSAAGDAAWTFAKENWAKVLELYPDSGMMRLISGVISLTTSEQEKDVKAWFAAHEVPGAGKQLDQVLERQHVGVLLRQRETPVLVGKFPVPQEKKDAGDRPDCVGAPEPEATRVEAHGTGQGTALPPQADQAGSAKA